MVYISDNNKRELKARVVETKCIVDEYRERGEKESISTRFRIN